MSLDFIRAQIGFTDFAIKKNLESITQEDSLLSADEGGNSINWVLGHLLHSRAGMMAILGGERVTDERRASLYGRGSKPIDSRSDAISVEELLRLWDLGQTALIERVEATSEADLEDMIPRLFDPTKKETKATQMATLLFHECYHAGQLGVIRRNIGKAGAIA